MDAAAWGKLDDSWNGQQALQVGSGEQLAPPFPPYPMHTQARLALCQVLINAIEVLDAPLSPGASFQSCSMAHAPLALYPHLARFNHSCRPQAVYHVAMQFGARLGLRLVSDVEQGQEICISYTELLSPTQLRQQDLWCR